MPLGRRPREDALQQGPRKRPTAADPLVHHGRHFGRTIFAFANVKSLVMNGLDRMAREDTPEMQALSTGERREDSIFKGLLKVCHGLEDRLLESNQEEIELIADLIQKGANTSRADDTKGMKSSVLEWITPEGQAIIPPIHPRSKHDRGFHHEQTGALLCPAGVDWRIPHIKEKLRSGELHVKGHQWPIFLYTDLVYDRDDPWDGLLRNNILVAAYKHVFTSPSSVDVDDPTKAPRSGNARIHGMTCVTKASIAYIATQVRFSLSSAITFSRTDTVTDSENFYTSVLDLLEDPREKRECEELLTWWNKKIFPNTSPESILIPVEGSPLDRIRQKRNQEEALEASGNGSNPLDGGA